MTGARILLILSNPATGQALEQDILAPAGYEVTFVREHQAIEIIRQKVRPDVVIIGNQIGKEDGLAIGESLLRDTPLLPVILLTESSSPALAFEAWRRGFFDYLEPPLRKEQVLQAVRRALAYRERIQRQLDQEVQRVTQDLEKRLASLEAIHRVGRQVTSLLDLDGVLKAVVDAAVELTGAEEGSLLLLDESTGELYMRASRNFQEDFVRTFRLPIRDTLAGQVIRTGAPLLLDEKTPRKIKTAYLVYTLLYVPLTVKERVIGVLEVDNRKGRKPFSEQQVQLVSALADYAAVAVENARLYALSEVEREKLETILTSIEEGVIVLDEDNRVLMLNPKARQAFGLQAESVSGRRVREIIQHQDLLEMLREAPRTTPSRLELTLEDGRVLNALFSPIPAIGMVVTMQDITHLKELDRIKSEFVSTVSHDLRSPLTAILGYVELLERVGPLNEQQRDFVGRVELSVHNITSLINDLLELGRIEAGFDSRKEVVPVLGLIQFSIEEQQPQLVQKSQFLELEAPAELPSVLGNPVRLRQMLNNLVSNAIKYTPEGGKIMIRAQAEGEQIIVQIADTGQGIPASDQPYIFDKFYRASNVPQDAPGTGLGLAIVKSIVENHLGRVWVESVLGQGTTFTIVLPVTNQDI